MDGLWTAEFGGSSGIFGGGIVYFDAGKIWGGDSTYFYIGVYTLDGSTFRATLVVAPFIDGAESVFKTVGQTLTLELSGIVTGERTATAQGNARGIPHLKF